MLFGRCHFPTEKRSEKSGSPESCNTPRARVRMSSLSSLASLHRRPSETSGYTLTSSYYTGIPDPQEAQELRETYPRSIEHACTAIERADVLLVITGAGWGADGGLKTFAEIGEMYRLRGLDYTLLCRPKWVHSGRESDLDTFYGFWGAAFNSYVNALPHKGYGKIMKLRNDQFVYSKVHDVLQRSVGSYVWNENERSKVEAESHGNSPSEVLGAKPVPQSVIDEAPGAFFLVTSNIDSH